MEDVYIINSPIEEVMLQRLFPLLPPTKKTECVIFLTTFGGSGDFAYKTGRLLQRHFDKIKFVVFSQCKSAGTLLAIAGNEIIMSEQGELGPLDIQVIDGVKSARNSGLDFEVALSLTRNEIIKAFVEAFNAMSQQRVSRTHAIESAGKIAQGVASSIYSQIDPIHLGAMRRSVTIAIDYGTRLAEKSNSITDDNLQKLIVGYPTHSFCIDRYEAKKLFNSVKDLECDTALSNLASKYSKKLYPVRQAVQDSIVERILNEENKNDEGNTETTVDRNCEIESKTEFSETN